MNDDAVDFWQLTPARNDWKIRVTVARRWISPMEDDLHLILADKRGALIEAITEDVFRYKFMDLNQGDDATIHNFKVIPVNEEKVVIHPTYSTYRIVLGGPTELSQVSPNDISPQISYHFTTVTAIQNGNHDLNHTVDMVGILKTTADRMQIVDDPAHQRLFGERLMATRFEIMDTDGAILEGFAYGALGRYFLNVYNSTGEQFPICVLRFWKVEERPNRQGYRVVNMFHSEALLDNDAPEIPEIKDLRARYPSSFDN